MPFATLCRKSFYIKQLWRNHKAGRRRCEFATVGVCVGPEGKPHRVVVELGDPKYHLAIQAHKQGKALRCFGLLVRDGRSLVLQEPREIAVVEE